MIKLKINDVIKVEVKKIVSEGKGLAFFNQYTIFVNRGLIGDIVDVKINSKKKSRYFGNIISFHTKSSLRSSSQCLHFPTCGGCQYMDIDYTNQLKLKKDMYIDAIQQFSPALESKLESIIPCKSNIFYRNKMEFSFSSIDNELLCGLKKRHSYDEVVKVNDCKLQDKQTMLIVDAVLQFMIDNDIYDSTSNKQNNFLKQIMVRHSKESNTFMLNLFITENKTYFFKTFTTLLQNQFKNIMAIHLTLYSQQLGSPTTQTILCSEGDSHLVESLDWLKCYISPLSFFQTNSHQALVLYETIKEVANLNSTDTLLDLYCGTGTIGLFLSKFVKHVIGIEENEYAIEDAILNRKKNNISNIEFRCGRVKNILKFETFDVDCIIVDPPRSGIVPKALKRICDLKCKNLIYVSCHPVTLLRDLESFKENGYIVKRIIPVDMFPNTFHIESVVKLELN